MVMTPDSLLRRSSRRALALGTSLVVASALAAAPAAAASLAEGTQTGEVPSRTAALAEELQVAEALYRGPEPPPDAPVLRWRGQERRAGRVMYQVDGFDTVPMYFLQVPPVGAVLAGSPLHEVEAIASGVRNLARVTWLLRQLPGDREDSGSVITTTLPVGRPLESRVAEEGALQLAIWHLVEDVPLTEQTVPDGQVRARAAELSVAAQAADGAAVVHHNVRQGFRIEREDARVSEVRLRVTLLQDLPTDRLGSAQCLALAVGGRVGHITTGTENRVDPRSSAGSNELRSDPGCAVEEVESDADFNSAIVSLPVTDHSYTVDVTWLDRADPVGEVYTAWDQGVVAVNAAPVRTRLVATHVVDPTDLSLARAFFERQVMARVARGGAGGVMLLGAVLFVLLLLFHTAKTLAEATVTAAAGRFADARRRTGDREEAPELLPTARPGQSDPGKPAPELAPAAEKPAVLVVVDADADPQEAPKPVTADAGPAAAPEPRPASTSAPPG